MSDQIIVTNQEDLFIVISGARVTEFPDTGTIATMEKVAPNATFTGGLHGTGAIAVNGSSHYRLNLTIHTGSVSDARLAASVALVKKTGRLLTVSVTYKGTQYISGSCAAETTPTREFVVDGTPARTWALSGFFPIVVEVPIANAGNLTPADFGE